MARVYKAKQLSLDRTVAIKVLPKRMSENPEFVERFYKEGRAAARLSHNNIVQAIDVGSTPEDFHFFVMEYVEGKTLYDLMQPPPWARAARSAKPRRWTSRSRWPRRWRTRTVAV
jgi:serine/threonine-protein kinase